jgi:arsenate reductase (glutaredoxin)
MYKLYGIPNCGTVKKARDYMDKNALPVNFIDFKNNPLSKEDIDRWQLAFGGFPVNTKGVTYKKNKEEFEALGDREKALYLCEHSSMLKRPILEKDGQVLAFGFDEASYDSILKT